jgi:hypothetical protein
LLAFLKQSLFSVNRMVALCGKGLLDVLAHPGSVDWQLILAVAYMGFGAQLELGGLRTFQLLKLFSNTLGGTLIALAHAHGVI